MPTRLAAALAALALSTTAASAQSYPGDSGAGTQRGIQQLNNSGQVGMVTLFRHDTRTRILVQMHGTGGRAGTVRLVRGSDCDTLGAVQPYVLADVRGGVSRTEIGIGEARLLSGNYNIVMYSNNHHGATLVACGHLYE